MAGAQHAGDTVSYSLKRANQKGASGMKCRFCAKELKNIVEISENYTFIEYNEETDRYEIGTENTTGFTLHCANCFAELSREAANEVLAKLVIS